MHNSGGGVSSTHLSPVMPHTEAGVQTMRVKDVPVAFAAHTAAAAAGFVPSAPQHTMLRGLPVDPAAHANEEETQTSSTEPIAALTFAEIEPPLMPAKGPFRMACPSVAAAAVDPQQATRFTEELPLAVKMPHAVSVPPVSLEKTSDWLAPPGLKLADVVAACELSVGGAVSVKPCAVKHVLISAMAVDVAQQRREPWGASKLIPQAKASPRASPKAAVFWN